VEEVVLGDQLDFLEDMDVIDQLDRLASHGEG
jgi:hypothetical protein